jgi:hypothetical protein
VLDINATDEIELNATLVDINANVEISGTATTTGVHTFTAVPVFPNNTIETADIQADAIDGTKIADDAINSEHYTDGSIDTAHIADGQITTAKLATAVFTGATDIGADIADADLFLMDDGAGGTIRKTAASRIKTYAGGLTGVSTGSGNVTITDGNLIVASGHGIDFAATGDSSGGNIGELLDDYETGSFTPSYTVAGGAVTMGTQRGEYVKVGNLVYVQMELSTNGISSPSNDVGITGLPFTTGDETASALAIGILYRWNTDFDGDLIFRIAQDGVIVDIWKNASNSGSANRMQGSDFLDGSAKNALVVSGCYSVR